MVGGFRREPHAIASGGRKQTTQKRTTKLLSSPSWYWHSPRCGLREYLYVFFLAKPPTHGMLRYFRWSGYRNLGILSPPMRPSSPMPHPAVTVGRIADAVGEFP